MGSMKKIASSLFSNNMVEMSLDFPPLCCHAFYYAFYLGFIALLYPYFILHTYIIIIYLFLLFYFLYYLEYYYYHFYYYLFIFIHVLLFYVVIYFIYLSLACTWF